MMLACATARTADTEKKLTAQAPKVYPAHIVCYSLWTVSAVLAWPGKKGLLERAAQTVVIEPHDPEISVDARWRIPVANLDPRDADIALHRDRLPAHREDLLGSLALGFPESGDLSSPENRRAERRRAIRRVGREQLLQDGCPGRPPRPLIEREPACQIITVHGRTLAKRQ